MTLLSWGLIMDLIAENPSVECENILKYLSIAEFSVI